MKKIFTVLCIALMILLCAGLTAFADSNAAASELTTTSGAVVNFMTALSDDAIVVDSGKYNDAARFKLTYTGEGNAMYMIFVLEAVKASDGTGLVPKAENIVYINQTTSDGSGAVSFDNVYPSRLANDKKYFVYLTTNAEDTNVGITKPVASFSFETSGVTVSASATGLGLTDGVKFTLKLGDATIDESTGKNVSFDSIPDGTYTLTIKDAGFAPYTTTVAISGGEVELGEIQLRKWGHVMVNDGNLTSSDALQILRRAISLSSTVNNPYLEVVANVTPNDGITSTDALQVLRHAIGLSSVIDNLE